MDPESKLLPGHQTGSQKKKSKLELIEPDATDVKRLVVNYLSHYTYNATAKALISSSASVSTSNSTNHDRHTLSLSKADNTASAPSSSSRPPILPPIADPNGDEGEDSMMASVVMSAPVGEQGGDDLMAANGAEDPDGDAVMGLEGDSADLAGGASKNGNGNGKGKHVRDLDSGSVEMEQVAPSGSAEAPLSKNMRHRREINHKVLLGDISAALALINLYFPTLFDSSPVVAVALGRPSTTPSSTPPIKQASTSASLPSKPLPASNPIGAAFASSSSATLSNTVNPSLSSKPSTSSSSSSDPPPYPLPPTSLDPSHLYINLLLQSFIESIRVHPLPDPLAKLALPSNGHSAANNTSTNGNGSSNGNSNGNGNGNGHSHPTLPSSTSTSTSNPASPSSSILSTASSTSSLASISASLSLGRTLYSTIESLPSPPLSASPTVPNEKEFYRAELIGVSSLLGYVPPESAPRRDYLEQERREALMEQVNSVLLVHSGQPPQPLLETLARQTTIIWDRLSQHNIDPIPPWTREQGAQWEKLAIYFRDHRKFDLSEFIDE